MKRLLSVLVVAAALLTIGAPAANAHPLGNFTINLYSGLRIRPDGVALRYVVDMAEIPTFQERHRLDPDGDGRVDATEAAAYATQSCTELAAHLTIAFDGHDVAPVVRSSAVTQPPGAAGLPTTRIVCELTAAARIAGITTIAYRDQNDVGRVGWHEVTATGDGTTLTATDVPSASISAELTRYPQDLLRSPLDVRTASIRARIGGALASEPASGTPSLLPRGIDRATRAFTSLLAQRRFTLPLAALALVLALGLGALHALAPGHGKTVMAAYLVGQKGSLRQGALIGLTVTATHTAGVLVLGLIVSASTALAPERLYPMFGIASGALLATIGAGLLRRALRARRTRMHAQDPTSTHAGHTHGHMHDDAPLPDALRARNLIAVGFAGGLVPSPSAIVVLLGAIAVRRTWFGVALVVAYGLGMAATLSGAGLVLVKARGMIERRTARGLAHGARHPFAAVVARTLPVLTAGTILSVGVVFTARGLIQI